ncbi:MAG: hypothetical protein QOG04_1145 [Actinomycetota bacterium]|jgi:hypothetical protein|nr:hypothetical protein [Actinomycetota bacterium]
MDDAAVRTAAEEHANATVAKDFKVAGATLSEPAMAQAGDVMKAMPGELTGCAITGLVASGDETVVTIAYRGESGETTVESRWAEVDGRPMIVNLAVL